MITMHHILLHEYLLLTVVCATQIYMSINFFLKQYSILAVLCTWLKLYFRCVAQIKLVLLSSEPNANRRLNEYWMHYNYYFTILSDTWLNNDWMIQDCALWVDVLLKSKMCVFSGFLSNNQRETTIFWE